MIALNKIYNCDCIKGIGHINYKSIDMVLTDLPYGTTAQNEWDTKIPYHQLWNASFHHAVKDNAAICLFSQSPFDKELACSNLENYRYEWIWEKDQGTGHLNANRMPLKIHENILVFYRSLPKYYPQKTPIKKKTITRSGELSNTPNYNQYVEIKKSEYESQYPVDILYFKSENGLHPTQKPTPLCEYLIKTYTDVNDVVLDLCMGSGTTAEACIRTGRQFIGFEKEKTFYDAAQTRIKKAQEQLKISEWIQCP